MRKALIFLAILDDTDIDWIVRNGVKKPIGAGSILIREGHPVAHIFFVLEGEFRVSTGRANREITRLQAGEILGEMSFVDSRPPSATVTATVDSVIGAVERDRLQQRLEVDVRFAARFYQAIAVLLTDRLRTTVGHLGYDEQSVLEREREALAAHLLDKVELAGNRFNEMQVRSWGD